MSEYQRRRAVERGERPDNVLYTQWEAEAKASAKARRQRRKDRKGGSR